MILVRMLTIVITLSKSYLTVLKILVVILPNTQDRKEVNDIGMDRIKQFSKRILT